MGSAELIVPLLRIMFCVVVSIHGLQAAATTARPTNSTATTAQLTATTSTTSPPAVDGQWTAWGLWSDCSTSCGPGIKFHLRNCTNPPPSKGGKQCTGEKNETTSCSIKPCPIDGGWRVWGSWTPCSVSCGDGFKTRIRNCTNPAPSHGGKMCGGNPKQEWACKDGPCPVDGKWSTFSNWTPCSRSCGSGNQTRTRACNNPTPSGSGKPCPGEKSEHQLCNTQSCPVDGGWSLWGDWSFCSATCGDGFKSRSRKCSSPPPSHGGKLCIGNETENSNCDLAPCPVDGLWSEFTDWIKCSKSCGGGDRYRERTCTNPSPSNGGNPCSGRGMESESCNTHECPFTKNVTMTTHESPQAAGCADDEVKHTAWIAVSAVLIIVIVILILVIVYLCIKSSRNKGEASITKKNEQKENGKGDDIPLEERKPLTQGES